MRQAPGRRRRSVVCCWPPPSSARPSNSGTSSSSTTSSLPTGDASARTFPSTRSSWIPARRPFSATTRPVRPAQAPRPLERYMPVIMPRFSHRLALKIVLPFAALTLAIGAVGTLTATGELNARSQEGFDSQLGHDGFVTQSLVVAGGSERRAILRRLTARPGLSQSWDKTATLTAWLERALTIHPNVIVEAGATPGPDIAVARGRGGPAAT